jgi:hypothetical protein
MGNPQTIFFWNENMKRTPKRTKNMLRQHQILVICQLEPFLNILNLVTLSLLIMASCLYLKKTTLSQGHLCGIYKRFTAGKLTILNGGVNLTESGSFVDLPPPFFWTEGVIYPQACGSVPHPLSVSPQLPVWKTSVSDREPPNWIWLLLEFNPLFA